MAKFLTEVNKKEEKPLELTTNIQCVTSLSKNNKLLLSSVLFGKESFKEFHPSQEWLGKKAGIRRETVCIKTTGLHERGLIVKKDRGFRLINYKERICLKETCSYSVGPMIKELNRNIKLNSEYPADDYQKLISSIPALYYVFHKNLTDILNLIKYNKILRVSTKRKESDEDILHSKSSNLRNDVPSYAYFDPGADKRITSTASVCPRDMAMDWMPNNPPVSAAPLTYCDYYDEIDEWNNENEWEIARLYHLDFVGRYRRRQYYIVKQIRISKERREKKEAYTQEFYSLPQPKSLLQLLLDKKQEECKVKGRVRNGQSLIYS